jgi:transposase-like protein
MAESMSPRRRAKRFLSAEQKYEIWLKILTGELTSREAAAQAGVDRSTIMTLRKTARDGAIAALQASRPGRPRDAREASEVARLQAENARLSATIVEQAIELAALRGKSAWG